MSEIGMIGLFLKDKSKINKDWIPLDGRSVNIADYPLLAQQIEGVEGFVSSSSKITVPNYEGFFLRYDPNRTIGAVQDDTIQNHQHPVIYREYEGGNNTQALVETKVDIKNANMGPNYSWITAISVGTGHVNAGDDGKNHRTSDETRPKNIAVVYAVLGR